MCFSTVFPIYSLLARFVFSARICFWIIKKRALRLCHSDVVFACMFFSLFFRLMLTTTRTHSFHRMDSISSNDSNPIRHLHKIRLINNFCLWRIFSSLSFNGNRITKFSVFIFFDVLGYEFRCVVDATATGDMKLWKMIPFSFDCFHLNFVYFNN